MKKIIVLFLFFVFAGCSNIDSDQRIVDNNSTNYPTIKYPLPVAEDSLLFLLKKIPDDTNKVNVLNELGWTLKYNNPDTAVILSMQALSIAKKISLSSQKNISLGGKKGISSSLGNLGAYNFLKGDYAKALDYYFMAMKVDEGLNNKKRIASHYGNIGIVYRNQADYSKALEYYFKALKIDEELRRSPDKTLSLAGKKGMATRLGNIGIVYDEQADYQKALDYYLKALKIDEDLSNKNGIAIRLGNIGVAYYNKAEQSRKFSDTSQTGRYYAKALNYIQQALKMDEIIENKNRISYDLGNIGTVFHSQGDLLRVRGDIVAANENYSIALDNYRKAFKIAQELENKNGMALHLSNIGSLCTSQENYTGAYENLYRALAISDSIGAQDLVKDNYKKLTTLYENAVTPLYDTIGGRILSREEMRLRALYYYKRYMNLSDTIYSAENKKQMVRKEMNFEFEKKEALAKAEQVKKDVLAKEELRQKEQERNYFILGFVLVALLVVFVFRGYRQKQKANEIITKQKMLVEEKQKEILDSIYYAKRIQHSLLPTEKYIAKTLKRMIQK